MAVLIKDVMLRPLTININKNVKTAGELMAKNRRDTLIVIKNRNPVGLITDSDLIKKVIAKNKKPTSLKAKDIMSRPLVTIDSDQSILEAVRKMKKSNIKRLIILEKGKLNGVITLSDIARHSPDVIDLLEYRLKTKESAPVIREKFTSGMCDYCGNYTEDLKSVDEKWLCESCREELEE